MSNKLAKKSNNSDLKQTIAQRQITEIHQGPIPSPKVLEDYEKICPGSADRIIKAFEKQVDHRFNIEDKQIDLQELSLKHNFEIVKRGQLLGTVLAVILFSITAFLTYNGKNIAAFFLGASGFVTIIISIIKSRVMNTVDDKKSESKQQEEEG